LRIQIMNETRVIGKQDQHVIPWRIENNRHLSYAKT
jgi:hypothetical protein